MKEAAAEEDDAAEEDERGCCRGRGKGGERPRIPLQREKENPSKGKKLLENCGSHTLSKMEQFF